MFGEKFANFNEFCNRYERTRNNYAMNNDGWRDGVPGRLAINKEGFFTVAAYRL